MTGAGTANLASLRREVETPFADRLSGTTDWGLVINVRPESSTWTFESSLKGAVIDLPAPLGKAAADGIPLKVEFREEVARPDEDAVDVSYGRLLLVAAHRQQRRAGPRTPRRSAASISTLAPSRSSAAASATSK